MTQLLSIITLVFLVTASVVSTSGCRNFTKIKKGGGGLNNVASNPNVGFQEVLDAVIRPRCISCHLERHNAYEFYAVVKASVPQIVERVTSSDSSRRMPKDLPPLSEEELNILLGWINAGAPEFAAENEGADDKELEPTWSSLQANVFGPKCILCHNAHNDEGLRDFSSYDAFVSLQESESDIFNTERPEESHFYKAIMSADDHKLFYGSVQTISSDMDMSAIDSPTELELNVIKEWISLGLPKE